MKLITYTALAGVFAAQLHAAPEDFADVDPMTIRLAHVVNEDDGFHAAAEKFAEIVATETGDKITIEIFPNATLGDERTLLEGMQIGSIDMGVITNGPVSNFLEDIAVFELPFLFPSNEAAYEVLDGEIGQELLDRLSEVNLKGLAYAERGFRNLTNSERPVETPEDIADLKIRVMENPVYTETFRSLGANAIPMAWTEALTAMQQGTIDGQENPVNVIHSFNLSETQKYMTMTRHAYAPAIFVVGMPTWQKLPEAAHEVFETAAQEAAEYERNLNAEQEAEQIAALKEQGMEIIETPDLSKFQEQVNAVYDQYGEAFGDYLPRIREVLAE